jgi:hypothetical protein
MKTFEKIYESSKYGFNNKYQSGKLKEVNYSFITKDELIDDLKVVMNEVIFEYKNMDLTKDQFIECIEKVCDVVKNDVEKSFIDYI